MAKTKKEERYLQERDLIREHEGISEEDTEYILEFLDANDSRKSTFQMPDGKTKAYSTLRNYGQGLRRVAGDLDMPLSEATSRDFNLLMDDFKSGQAPSVKDSGLSQNTVRTYQGPIRRFLKYYHEWGVDEGEISLEPPDDPAVDTRDMFTKEEVQALRDEARNRGTRDACLVDLLLYTGQRKDAIMSLRLKDVDVDQGVFWLNDSDGDLKGASGKRPLLGAEKSVRDWKRQHPTGEREDFLITHKQAKHKNNGAELGDKLNPSSVYTQLQRIGDGAGVDKPVNAHNFRHYFVTACKRDYGMDDATVKHLIGHAPDSSVMETTYSHLTDEDYIQDAEEKVGIREPEKDNPLTPNVCNQCGEPLEGEWEACPYCGMIYSPAAQQTKEKMEDTLWEGKAEAGPDTEESEGVDELRRLLKEKPELLEELTD